MTNRKQLYKIFLATGCLAVGLPFCLLAILQITELKTLFPQDLWEQILVLMGLPVTLMGVWLIIDLQKYKP